MIRSFFKAKARFPIFSVHDLDIMRTALRNNERDGITGFLLRDGNTYWNVTEGPEDKVDAMLKRVESDPRAFGFEILALNDISKRQYPAWSMGYHEGNQKIFPQNLHDTARTSVDTQAVDMALSTMRSLGLRQISMDRQFDRQICPRKTA